MKKWVLRGCKTPYKEIVKTSKELNIPVIIGQLLAVRGYDTKEKIQRYFNVSMSELHDPVLMKDMDKGCKILLQAIKEGKKIAVFGDYDADGITSTSILMLAITRLGGIARYYIPARETEGYGLNNQAVKDLAEEGIELLLTCDNGISAFEQVELAKKLGMTVVIADHHEVPFEIENGEIKYILPCADAIINPKQADCSYPFKCLCAGTIAYKLTQYLYMLAGKDWSADGEEYLSLSIVATICDIMDLTDENRIMVKYGLSAINKTSNLGLRALLNVNGLLEKEIGTYQIGFIIGPCINASGRLELADIAVNLFLADSEEQAVKLAKQLVDLNNSRKNLSNEGVEMVKKTIEADQLYNNKVILVHQPDLHESIAGIVSGRIKEMYYRPTFVFASNKDIIRGSGRSIEGYNMFEALVECSHLLDIFGGHPMAAGLSLKKENFSQLRKELNDNCKLDIADMVPTTYIDLRMPVERASLGLAKMLSKLEPFGKGNAIPLFGDKDLSVNRIQLLGSDNNIVKIFFDDRRGKGLISSILFRKKDEFQQMVFDCGGETLWEDLLKGNNNLLNIDIIYTVEINNFN
ncbi:MAG: single-stranded-DNA-specific exonuclease RecJ, partial [Bacillota bacterium]